MDPEAFQYFLAEFAVHAVIKEFLPERVQVLVNPAERCARSGVVFIRNDQHMSQPQGLNGLPECLRRFPGDDSQVFCHDFQFSLPAGI